MELLVVILALAGYCLGPVTSSKPALCGAPQTRKGTELMETWHLESEGDGQECSVSR